MSWRDGFQAGRAEILAQVRALEGENLDLKGLVGELAFALDGWSDSKDDPAIHDLVARARAKAGAR